MAKNAEDTVKEVCEIILGLNDLEESLNKKTIEYIEKNAEYISVFKLANEKCDFKSIVNENISLLISTRRMISNANAFKDKYLSNEWNKVYFQNLFNEFCKYDPTCTKPDFYWIKEIIDARYWTVQNIDYITNFSVEIAKKAFDSFKTNIESDYDELKDKVSNADEQLEGMSASFDSAKKEMEMAISSTNNLLPNMLTSLGIFVTIIVTIVALYISNVLGPSQIEFAIPQMRYARYVLSGQITFNCIFLLLYFISKLTGKTIHTLPSQGIKLDNLNFLQKSLFVNPLMWTLNSILIMAYIFLYDWWIFEKYIWPQLEILIGISKGVINNQVLLFALINVLIVTLLPIIAFTIFFVCTKCKAKK